MAKYYDAKTGGFYSEKMHGKRPKGAVKVSEELHAQLMAGQSAGKEIQADSKGRPKLGTPKPAPAAPDLAAAINAIIDGDLNAAKTAMNRED